MCVSPACGFWRPEQTTRDLGFLEDVAGETGAWDGPPTPHPLWPCPDARKLGAEPEPRRDQDPVSQEEGVRFSSRQAPGAVRVLRTPTSRALRLAPPAAACEGRGRPRQPQLQPGLGATPGHTPAPCLRC